MYRRVALLLIVAIVLCAATTCHNRAGLEEQVPAPPDRLAEAGAAAAAQPAPPGIAAELWRELTLALVQALDDRAAGRLKVMNTLEPPLAFRLEGEHLVWTARLRGDYDNNGEVNIADLSALAFFYGAEIRPTADGRSPQERVDGDGNGELNMADVTPLALHYGESLTGYAILRTEYAQDGNPAELTMLSRPQNAGGTTAPTPVLQFTPTLDGYYAVSPRGTGQSPQVRSELLFVDVATPGPGPDPDPEPEPEPIPDPDPDPPPPPDAPKCNVVVSVVDPWNEPLGNAAVILAGREAMLANEHGWVLFRDVQPADSVAFTARYGGYVDSTEVVQLIPGQEAFVRIEMAKRMAPFIVNPVVGGNLVGLNKAGVTFPPNSIVDSSGNPVTDLIQVSLTPIDVSDARMLATMPGNFTARQLDGSTAVLRSLGVMEVFADDGLGNGLDVAPGAEVGLAIPNVREVSPGLVPATMGLYDFDAESGTWVEEGVLTYDELDDIWVGSSGRISNAKNCDIILPKVGVIRVQVKDILGKPAAGVHVMAGGTNAIFSFNDTSNEQGVAWLFAESGRTAQVGVKNESKSREILAYVEMPDEEYVVGGPPNAEVEIQLPYFYVGKVSLSLTSGAGRDLDLHVLLPGMIGYREWCNRLKPEYEIASMSTDSAEGGLERIMLSGFDNGNFDIFAYQFSGPEGSGIEESQAQFTLWAEQLGAINVSPLPDNPKNYRAWHIGQLKYNGATGKLEFVEINRYTDDPVGMY